MTRALVLGARGHIGHAVVHALAQTSTAIASITCITRAVRHAARAELGEVSVDSDDPAALGRVIAGHDVVVDAAAPAPLLLRAPRHAVDNARRRTFALVEACAQNGARLAFVSSFTTKRAALAGHPYFAVKREMESIVTAALVDGAVAGSVLRPTTCLGPFDSRAGRASLVGAVVAGAPVVAMRHVVNVIDVRDVATAVVAAAVDGRAPACVDLAGHDVTADDLVARIAAAAGVPARGVSMPAPLAVAGAGFLEAALGRVVDVPPALYALLVAASEPATPSDAQLALGAAPRPLADTVRDAVEWHRRGGARSVSKTL